MPAAPVAPTLRTTQFHRNGLEPSQANGTCPAPVHQADLALVRRILDGDEAAWSWFVERYAGLILAMTRRYLHTHDVDDIRSVFVNVLESLRRARLRT